MCIVCGRVFPRGQGIILTVGGQEYTFHSKACAIKFIKRVIEEMEPGVVRSVFDRVKKEFEEELEERREKTAKRIA